MTVLGVRLPNDGDRAASPGLAAMARAAEDSGVFAAHLSDHVVLVEGATSRYPFSADGVFGWPPDLDVYDPMVACAWIGAATSRLRVGPSVLVLAQRHPLEVAKTAATIDRLTGGRLFLGVGSGWLAEEFAALGKDFGTRTARTVEYVDVLRRAWSGDTTPFRGRHVEYGPGVHCRPLPANRSGVPVMLGGMSAAAVRRAATIADGWIAIVNLRQDPAARRVVLDRLQALHDALARSGRDRADFHTVLRVVGVQQDELRALPELVASYAAIGFDEVAVDPLWRDLDESSAVLRACRKALDG